MNGWRAYVLECIQVLHDGAYSHIREKYREKLQRSLHIMVKFSLIRVTALSILAPRFMKYGATWVCCVGGFATIFPQREKALSWVFLMMMVIMTIVIIYENGEDYFKCGVSHSSIAATLMVFFGGMGARAAVTFATVLCVMCSAAAPSNMVALNIGVACVAQMIMCVVLEVSFLQQLAETEKVVEEMKAVDEKKANFMAIVSHELKSPLHGIIGLSSSLISNQCGGGGDGGSDQPTEKHLTLILSCARRLLDMVTDIMDASVLVHDKKMKLSRDRVHFDRIVEDVVTLCRHSVDRNGKPLVGENVCLVNLVGSLPTIEGDFHRCTQLMHNLVSNALKFTKVGHVRMHGQANAESGTITITVEDTGIGIAEENLDRIFRPFDQEDESEQRHYDGLGLGLSICKEVVEKHGGSLTVESRKGEGSRFHATLPFHMRKTLHADVEESTVGDEASLLGEILDDNRSSQGASQSDPSMQDRRQDSVSCLRTAERSPSPLGRGQKKKQEIAKAQCASNDVAVKPLGPSQVVNAVGSAEVGTAACKPELPRLRKLDVAPILAQRASELEESPQAVAPQLHTMSHSHFSSSSRVINDCRPAHRRSHNSRSGPESVSNCSFSLEMEGPLMTMVGAAPGAQRLPRLADNETLESPPQGVAPFVSLTGCSEASSSKRWQLQKCVAHQALNLRHLQRDLAAIQAAIQQRDLLIGTLEKQSRNQCRSRLESSMYQLEKLQKQLDNQALELQQKGIDLANMQGAIHESLSRIQNLKLYPHCSNFLAWLERSVALQALTLQQQKQIRLAAESSLQQQATIIQRIQHGRPHLSQECRTWWFQE